MRRIFPFPSGFCSLSLLRIHSITGNVVFSLSRCSLRPFSFPSLPNDSFVFVFHSFVRIYCSRICIKSKHFRFRLGLFLFAAHSELGSTEKSGRTNIVKSRLFVRCDDRRKMYRRVLVAIIKLSDFVTLSLHFPPSHFNAFETIFDCQFASMLQRRRCFHQSHFIPFRLHCKVSRARRSSCVFVRYLCPTACCYFVRSSYCRVTSKCLI